MYSHLPPRQRVLIRTLLALMWASSALSGMAVLIAPTPASLEVLGLLRNTAGAVLTLTATLGAIGVATNRYRIEWVASWFSAAALVPYTMAFWYSVFEVSFERATSAFLLTALVFCFVYRAASCSAHAQRLRDMHEEEPPNA
jgi:hypothetical protein